MSPGSTVASTPRMRPPWSLGHPSPSFCWKDQAPGNVSLPRELGVGAQLSSTDLGPSHWALAPGGEVLAMPREWLLVGGGWWESKCKV